jgi:hypothetical protein
MMTFPLIFLLDYFLLWSLSFVFVVQLPLKTQNKAFFGHLAFIEILRRRRIRENAKLFLCAIYLRFSYVQLPYIK